MHKVFKILGILIVILVIICAGFFIWLRSKLPAKEERISHNNSMLIETIDKQLDDVNTERVESKAKYIRQKSVAQIQSALRQHKITHEDLVAYYLIRIKTTDQNKSGNNAVSEINPHAIQEARRYDKINSTKALAGIPVLVKENINTNDMPTSAGTYALRNFVPKSDASVIKELNSNGAIILGKTNLSELANYMSSNNPDGYSTKKGQTMNPFYPLKISALGSSTGSAVAMATDLATVSLGTETSGSIVAPSSVTSVVGYKPTHGKINGEGVIPISYALDTVGVISKSVEDALVTYNAAAAESKRISATLDKNAIKGKVVGIVKSSDDDFDSKLKNTLKNIGAKSKFVKLTNDEINVSFILENDFEKDLNHYMKTYHTPVRTLKELVAYNKKDEKIRMRYGQDLLEEAIGVKRNDSKVQSIIRKARAAIDKTMADNGCDILVTKDYSLVDVSATAGSPELCVPLGMLNKAPVGATFFSKVNDDRNVLEIAYSFEQLTKLRKIPESQDN